MIGIGAIFPFLSSFLFLWLPESPKLLFKLNKKFDSLKAIKTIVDEKFKYLNDDKLLELWDLS